MSSLAQRGQVITLLSEAIGMGARQDRACAAICLSERTVQRWQRDVARGDQRLQRLQAPKNKLSVLERERLVAVANSDEFGHLPPGQIVPRLADRGQYIASESTFNRVLKARRAHSAVESAINALEVHGLDMCPDHGINGFRRYVAFAVVTRNIHRIGAILWQQEQKREKRRQRCSNRAPPVKRAA